MNFELKKSLSTLELSDLVRIIEMQEKDIKLVDMSYDERLELLLSTLVQERENRLTTYKQTYQKRLLQISICKFGIT